MGIQIYHNPRCSKSRAALNLLEEKGVNYEVVDYLKNPPSVAELTAVLDKLGMEPQDLIRQGEAEYKEHVQGKNLSRDELIAMMVQHPKMIERPIVTNDLRAAIARPLALILPIIA
ncbi:MAG: arsenate reductase (glutaredoxin) [Ghiorsea sp.]|nr:arsenate reductase (glutaredoxin) [Ghiorsea sp.]